MGFRSGLFCGAFALSGAFGASGAVAADAAAASQPPPAAVQEVTVTARKRAENLQTIPQSVSAVSMRQMEERGLRSAADLGRTVPSLVMDPSNGTASGSSTGMVVSIRGQVAIDTELTASSPVGIYEDNVDIPHMEGTDVALFDLDRVEVLRGPQGTLYGRNTTGGAINIITRGADYNGIHGYALAEGGNFDDWKLGGAVNLPIIPDVFSVRLAYQHWNREGFGESAITGQRIGDSRDDDIARATFRFDPTASFSSQLKVEYFRADHTAGLYQTRELLSPATANAEWALEGMPGGVSPTQAVALAGSNIYTNYSTTLDHERVSGWHVAWDSNWKINDAINLRSITGLHQFTDFQIVELGAAGVQTFGEGVGVGNGGKDFAGGVDARPLIPDQESLQWSQEFDLSGHFLDDHINWLLGGFVSKDSGHENQTASVYPAILDSLGPLGAFDVSFFDPRATSSNWAIFTQDDFKFNDIFSITAGWRYTEESLSSDSSFMLHLLGPNQFFCQAGPNLNMAEPSQYDCLAPVSTKSSGDSYLLSLNFQLTHHTLFYVKTARGFRGGALQERAPGTAPAKPETDVDYEIGLKTQALGGRIRANMDIYETFYKNKQQSAIVALPSGAIFTPIVNAASAHVKGFEGEFTAVPIERLNLTADVTYIDGRYSSYLNALTPWGTVIPDASGVHFQDPHWVIDLGGHYSAPIGPGILGVTADYNWTSRILTTPLNNDPGLSPLLQNYWRSSVGLVNATIDYRLPEQGLTFSVFATNLLDLHYQRYGLTFASPPLPWGYTGFTQAPRMFGVTIRKSFGSGE